MKLKVLNVATLALFAIATMMAAPQIARSDTPTDPITTPPLGSCPPDNNACNDPDGCFAINQRVYRVYKGMVQCTWGTSSCSNTISRPCYEKFNVVDCTPPSPTIYGTGTTINEDACR